MQISTSPVFGREFVNVLGQPIKRCLGEKIDISASFHLKDETSAKSISAACNNDKITVTYLDPRQRTAVFDRPSVSVSPVFEDNENMLYWNISISMTCPLMSSGP